jgi:integrase
MIVGTTEQYPTQAKALRAAEHMRLGANADHPQARTVTFGALIDRYMAEEMPERYSTRRAYRSKLLNHVRPKWASYAIADVKPFAVAEWLKQLALAPKTKAHLRNLMRVLFNYAMLWELVAVQENPMKLVKVKDASKRQREPRVLTIAEFKRLLHQVQAEPFRTMLLVAACLGLRCSEVLGLKWSDFDWEDLTLLVQRAVVCGHEDTVKTKYSKDRVPLSASLAEVLIRWKARTPFGQDSDWVFASPYQAGRMPYREWNVYKHYLRPAGIKAGLGEGIGWHTLRHSYRSWLDETGAPMKVQQELMRHADIRTTMNIYGAAMDESKRRANDKVVEMVFAKSVG